MAMAKPINSLQFIFLNHLSSHEKIFIKVTPSKCLVCVRSLMCLLDCIGIVHWLWFRLNDRHELLLKAGKNLITFCTFRVASSLAGMAAEPLIRHPMMASPLTSDQVTPDASLLLSRASDVGWPGPGGHRLGGVDPRMATPMCSVYGAATCDGKCSQRGN